MLLQVLNQWAAAYPAMTTGVYNSSMTPSFLPWDTYNYCNAPHVNADHYYEPADATLVYLNVMIRHHKVSFDHQ